MTKNTAGTFPSLGVLSARELLEILRELGPLEALGSRHKRPSSTNISDRKAPHSFDPSRVGAIHEQVLSLAKTFPLDITRVEKARNAFDLALARLMFDLLRDFPPAVLMNRDFWRYLAIFELFEIGAWRYPDQGKKTWGQNFGVSGSFSRCFPYKAYLRGKLVSTIVADGLPWTDVEDVDFYDSHLFGRRNGLIPGVAAALNSVRTKLPSSRALDPYATVIRQYRGTHLTELLSQDELHAVMNKYVTKQIKSLKKK